MGTIKKQLIHFYNKHYLELRRIHFNFLYAVKVMYPNETVDYILDNKCSISRFGDGELGIILGSNKPEFQDYDAKLQKRLIEVLQSKDNSLLICLPAFISIRRNWTKQAEMYWERWFWDDYKLFRIAEIASFNHFRARKYGNAHITRPYMDYKDKAESKARFMKLQQLWEDKNVIIVEGKNSRLGIGNDIFNNCRSIKRIICPSKNAFDKYNKILATVLEKRQFDELILVALGPTATVLCYDLSKCGIQALDVGHIDIEYEWYLSNASEKKVVSGKDSWEGGLKQIDENDLGSNEEYISQIIARID